MSVPDSDRKFMQIALSQAQKAVGNCGNNPAVGCVIASEQRVIAQGFTQPSGVHAEIDALNQVKLTDLTQAEIFITLEPCCFHGRTPPCTEALISACPKRIIIAHRDPHPLVRGKGISALKAANLEITEGVLAVAVALMLKDWLAQFPPIHDTHDT